VATVGVIQRHTVDNGVDVTRPAAVPPRVTRVRRSLGQACPTGAGSTRRRYPAACDWACCRLSPVACRLSPVACRHLARLARAAGVPYRGVHALRHACGTRLMREKKDLEVVARMLGHSSLETARIYAKWDDTRAAEAVATW